MLRRLKVLAVEDSQVSFAVIRLAMKRMPGWCVDQARDGNAAIAVCAATDPDVVTLDLSLAEGGGLELLSRLKAQFDLPIVVLSASTYEGSPVTAEALRRGADACFDKARILTDAPRFLKAISDAARHTRQRPRQSVA